ncbi:hypothetical protein D6F57_24850, partial [Salmonella enterica]|nr:hypothetical protein [Salmonella enterica]
DLDAAYLAHQTLLPNTFDANELLVQLLSDTFSSIIRYKNLNHYIDEKTLKLWLEHNIEEGERPLYTKDGAEDNVRYIRNAGVLLNLLKTNADVREKYCNSLLSTDSQPIAKAKIELLMKKFATT